MTESDETTTTVVQQANQHSLVVRFLWWLLVGWWASGIVLAVAWILNVTVVGIPLGIKLINKVPFVLTLKKQETTQVITQTGEQTTVEVTGPAQHNLLLRAVYFLLVGWWFSGVWMGISWLISLTVIGLPLSLWMLDRLPFVVSLYKLEN
ncbi:YccF domain-containing protein [Halorientalis brevis]|uniref:YccF domain-containing protein n=1 Tax=Halorientalis brevis TaxID=1126241 RepID=A0ABD6CH74_9EURY|nr:YccF domain-containing protein [Halorientalis brevis]